MKLAGSYCRVFVHHGEGRLRSAGPFGLDEQRTAGVKQRPATEKMRGV